MDDFFCELLLCCCLFCDNEVHNDYSNVVTIATVVTNKEKPEFMKRD